MALGVTADLVGGTGLSVPTGREGRPTAVSCSRWHGPHRLWRRAG
jgi:hypothetical protein